MNLKNKIIIGGLGTIYISSIYTLLIATDLYFNKKTNINKKKIKKNEINDTN